MIDELVAIDNTLMIIAGSLFWLAVAQTLFLCAIFLKLRSLLSSGERKQENTYEETDSIHNGVKYHDEHLVAK